MAFSVRFGLALAALVLCALPSAFAAGSSRRLFETICDCPTPNITVITIFQPVLINQQTQSTVVNQYNNQVATNQNLNAAAALALNANSAGDSGVPSVLTRGRSGKKSGRDTYMYKMVPFTYECSSDNGALNCAPQGPMEFTV